MPKHPDQPRIQSVGPPPERHADRVVAEMAHWLEQEADHCWPLIEAVFRAGCGGSPKAQTRFLQKLRQVAGPALLVCGIQPGKRGRFAVCGCFWGLTNASRGTAKPQIECSFIIWQNLGDFRHTWSSRQLFVVSHHALSRLAQRSSVRTADDLYLALREMVMAMIDAIQAKTMDDERASPPEGGRLPFKGGVAVLRRDGEADETDLVVATVLADDDE